jgi:hypothetical protein
MAQNCFIPAAKNQSSSRGINECMTYVPVIINIHKLIRLEKPVSSISGLFFTGFNLKLFSTSI